MLRKAITANRLIDGRVVYLTPAEDWSPRLEDAKLAETEEAVAALLATAEEDVRAGRVVGPYAIMVEATPAGPVALGCRERIRTQGPSVRRDLGYQAGNG